MPRPTVKINAKAVLDDLRSGMDDAGLMAKYGLSFRQLQRLYRKLIMAGFISPLELAQRLCVTESQITEAFDDMKKSLNELHED